MTVPKRGPDALVDRLVDILETNLQTRLDVELAEAGDPFAYTIGDVVGTTTFEPVERPGSVLVGIVSSETQRGQPQNYGAAVRESVIAVVRAQVGQVDPSQIDRARRLVANAICSVVHGYLLRDSNPAGVRGLPIIRVLDRESSTRQRTGKVGLRGPTPNDPIDPVDVMVSCVQLVDRPAPI